MIEPKVSVIITSYCPESKKYLDQCVLSALNLSYLNKEIIIVGRPDYMPMYERCRTVSPSRQEFWNSTGLNHGVMEASSDSEYYFLLNDDVVLTKGCLEPLVNTLASFPKVGQVMPISNDIQGRYWLPSLMGRQAFDMNVDSPYPSGIMLVDTLCLYTQLISKRVWQAVGEFDESLKGQDDIDYSLRVKQAGYLNAIELASVVWHHGGVSAAHTLNPEKREQAKEIFNKKWAGVYRV